MKKHYLNSKPLQAFTTHHQPTIITKATTYNTLQIQDTIIYKEVRGGSNTMMDEWDGHEDLLD